MWGTNAALSKLQTVLYPSGWWDVMKIVKMVSTITYLKWIMAYWFLCGWSFISFLFKCNSLFQWLLYYSASVKSLVSCCQQSGQSLTSVRLPVTEICVKMSLWMVMLNSDPHFWTIKASLQNDCEKFILGKIIDVQKVFSGHFLSDLQFFRDSCSSAGGGLFCQSEGCEFEFFYPLISITPWMCELLLTVTRWMWRLCKSGQYY